MMLGQFGTRLVQLASSRRGAQRTPWSAAIRGRYAWLQLLAAGLLAALAWPLFAGRVFTADDLGAFHLPLRDFYARQLAAGQPFDWMPSLYCGFYVTGEGQLGAYHPLHQLLYRLLPLGAAFDWELLLHYPLMLLGMYVWLRRLVRQPDAALFGALTFTFSSFCLLHFVHPNALAIVAHLPWLLWAIDVALRPGSARDHWLAVAGIAALTGSQLLLGYPQFVWFSLLAETAYAGCLLAGSRRPGGRLVDLVRLAAPLVGAVGCGVLIGGAQWLPTFAALARSERANVEAGFVTLGSLHPLNLLQLVGPYLFHTRVVGQNTHELGMYCGAVPLVLCVWLSVNRRLWGRHTLLITAAAGLGMLALVYAFGQHAWLAPLQRYLPVVNRFRFPCRAIVLVQLGVAVLAAVAWHAVARTAERGHGLNRPAARALAAIGGISVFAAAFAPLLWPEFTAPALLIAVGPVLVVLATGLLWQALCGRRWALYALALLAVVDQGAYGLTSGAWRDTADLNRYAAHRPLPPPTMGARLVAGPAGSCYRTGDRWLLAGFTLADGYAGLEPARRLDYHAANAQRLAGVAYCALPAAEPKPGCQSEATAAPQFTRVPRPLPRVRLVSQVQAGRLDPECDAWDVDRVALLDQALPSESELEPGEPGVAQLEVDRPGRFIVGTNAPARQLLVLSEAFDPGWQARIGGHPVPVVRVNGDFLGCVVPAGKHKVELLFRPASLAAGQMLSWCGVGLTGLLVAWAFLVAQAPRSGGRGRSPLAAARLAVPCATETTTVES